MRRFSIVALMFATAGCYRVNGRDADAGTDACTLPDCVPVPDCGPFSAERCRFVGGVEAYSLASDGDRLYWVELRTLSMSGGALRSVSLDGGPVETIAEGLEEPSYVRVTSTHAYIQLSRYGSPAWPRPAVVRIPLEGGPLEVVAEEVLIDRYPCFQCFATNGDRAYFPLFHLYFGETIATSSLAEPSATTFVEVPEGVYAMAADADHLYFAAGTTPWEIRRIAWAGGTPERVATLPGVEACPFVVTDGFIVAAECTEEWSEIYLTRMPIDGGGWERFARLGGRTEVGDLTILSAGRWVAERRFPDPLRLSSGFLGSAAVATLATTTERGSSVATERGVFFVEGIVGEIHRAGW